MSQPIAHASDLAPATRQRAGALAGLASLPALLEVAFALRVLAAGAVERYVRRGGADRLCLFPDAWSYWELARTIRLGAPYELMWWGDIPHAALRTPGYPLFLAACQALFGERTLAVRLVQAALGTLGVYLVYRLTRTLARPSGSPHGGSVATSRFDAGAAPEPTGLSPAGRWTAPLVATALATFNPLDLFLSSLILSEAVFQPLMMLALLGLSLLWSDGWNRGRHVTLLALFTGISAGAAILVRPSWALFVPAILAVWIVAWHEDRRRLRAAARGALVCALGVVLVMGPWWARNLQVYGRFVPTALWLGASLYDGLNPSATGASDMSFLEDPAIWPRDEQDQDAELIGRAADFGCEHPLRVLGLAAVKLGRYWSPWPNAAGFRAAALSIAVAAWEVPLLFLMTLGTWSRRRDARALALLAGPLVYFCALHLVFASSMRYRVPAELPALGLAALGWTWRSGSRQAAGPTSAANADSSSRPPEEGARGASLAASEAANRNQTQARPGESRSG
jgi:4-amino-4-deoxy-L-arabinose transferase-like glycosyltransferase